MDADKDKDKDKDKDTEAVIIDVGRVNDRWYRIKEEITTLQEEYTVICNDQLDIEEKSFSCAELITTLGKYFPDAASSDHAEGLYRHVNEISQMRKTALNHRKAAVLQRLDNLYAAQNQMKIMGQNLDQELKDPCLCPICADAIVNTVFDPCGHTLCDGCARHVARRCHYCRRYIDKRIHIYLSGQGPVPAVQQSLDALVAAASPIDIAHADATG